MTSNAIVLSIVTWLVRSKPFEKNITDKLLVHQGIWANIICSVHLDWCSTNMWDS